jgi:hypothetical protein
MVSAAIDKQRSRRNLRTALVPALIALVSLAAFAYKVWSLG